MNSKLDGTYWADKPETVPSGGGNVAKYCNTDLATYLATVTDDIKHYNFFEDDNIVKLATGIIGKEGLIANGNSNRFVAFSGSENTFTDVKRTMIIPIYSGSQYNEQNYDDATVSTGYLANIRPFTTYDLTKMKSTAYVDSVDLGALQTSSGYPNSIGDISFLGRFYVEFGAIGFGYISNSGVLAISECEFKTYYNDAITSELCYVCEVISETHWFNNITGFENMGLTGACTGFESPDIPNYTLRLLGCGDVNVNSSVIENLAVEKGTELLNENLLYSHLDLNTQFGEFWVRPYNVSLTKTGMKNLLLNMGLPVALDGNINTPITDDNTIVPEIDPLTGLITLKEGDKDKYLSDYTIDPDAIEEEETPTEDIPTNIPQLTPYGVFTSLIAMDKTKLQRLARLVYTQDQTQQEQILQGLAMFGTNPISAIVSLRFYPFDITKFVTTTNKQIKLGGYATGIFSETLDSSSYVELNMGSINLANIKDFFEGDFSDITNTSCSIYLPYIGIMPLEMSDILNKSISVKYGVDLTCGSCIAYVYANKNPILRATGQIGTQMCITSNDSQNYALAMTQFAIQEKNLNIESNRLESSYNFSRANALMGVGSKMLSQASTGDLGGMMGSALTTGVSMYQNQVNYGYDKESLANNMDSLDLSARATSNPLMYSGASSPMLGLFEPQECYLILDKADHKKVGNYGATYGTPIFREGQLETFSGLTYVDGAVPVDESILMEDFNTIVSILKNGIFIK